MTWIVVGLAAVALLGGISQYAYLVGFERGYDAARDRYRDRQG